ncbi:MAG: hypothetical protein WED04_09200 [Promethearchaeati archaeon SRVP18_Atabeyarchaeia-1]
MAAADPGKHHRWKTREGEKRTIAVKYQPSSSILKYLEDMKDALATSLAQAYASAKISGRLLIPNPVALRRRVKPWFDTRCEYARHHVNPLCRTAVALLRSYRKRHGRLAMRIDSELFRLSPNPDGSVTVRVTLKPFTYEYITFIPGHKKWSEYSAAGEACEILLTDRKLCVTFAVGRGGGKPLAARLAGLDLNFHSADSSAFSSGSIGLESPHTNSLNRVVQVQNDFSRRRRLIRLHVRNPGKRERKLEATRGRQRDRVKDALHKLSTQIVRKNPSTSFVFEDLKGIRQGRGRKGLASSRRFRTYLNR